MPFLCPTLATQSTPSLDEDDLGDELQEDSQSILLHLTSVRGIALKDDVAKRGEI
jgi:hypothetical protein